MRGDVVEPINLGNSEFVTINQLVDIVEDIAGIKVKRNYNLSAPQGVNGRNSDNTMIQEAFGCQTFRCEQGLRRLTIGFTARSARHSNSLSL